MAEQEKTEVEQEPSEKIRFHYIKSNYFRIVHVDGIYGSISPNGLIEFSLYSERHPIPKSTVHLVGPDGELSDEVLDDRISLDGVVREVEVGTSMDIETAETLAEWLQEAVRSVKEARESIKRK